jgi:hypothetical protein
VHVPEGHLLQKCLQISSNGEVGATVSQLADHAFFGGLAAAAAVGEGLQRRQARRILRRQLGKLRVWARNFTPRQLLRNRRVRRSVPPLPDRYTSM